VRRRLEFFASQFEFCEVAAEQFEYKTKDTAKLSGIDWQQLTAMETGKDKRKDIGSQTRSGLSVRSLMTVMVFVKAMAFFRGSRAVTMEDVRQIIPFVLHDKLQQDLDAPFFHHLLELTVADRICDVPAHAPEDDVPLKMAAFKIDHRELPLRHWRRIRDRRRAKPCDRTVARRPALARRAASRTAPRTGA